MTITTNKIKSRMPKPVFKFDLKLGKNTKVGAAFDIEGGKKYSCIDATKICDDKYCYRNVGHNCYPVVKARRRKQFREVKRLLKAGKLFQALVYLLRNKLWLRLHSVGDFFSREYVLVWVAVMKTLPGLKLWVYTRSWKSLGASLSKLVALPNVKVWISADEENWTAALKFSQKHPEFAGIAFMQTPGAETITRFLKNIMPKKTLIVFPAHACGSQLRTGVKVVPEAPNCPAVLGKLPHDGPVPPCFMCKRCLPVSA